MKNVFPLSIVLFFLFTLSSCVHQNVNFDKSFKDDNVKIFVNATKSSPLNPWSVDLSAKVYGFEKGSLHFEQQVKTLSEPTITFDWQDENTCMIGFYHNLLGDEPGLVAERLS